MWSQAVREKGENLGEEEVGWKEKERKIWQSYKSF